MSFPESTSFSLTALALITTTQKTCSGDTSGKILPAPGRRRGVQACRRSWMGTMTPPRQGLTKILPWEGLGPGGPQTWLVC